MATDAATPPGTLSRNRTVTLLGQTMALVGATAGSFALGAHLARDLSPGRGWLFLIAAVASSFGLSAAVERLERAAAIAVLFAFGALLGAALAPTIAYYLSADLATLVLAALATGLFIAGFGAAGHATRRDLSGLARALFRALVALIAFGVVLILVQIPGGSSIYAVLDLVIFAGLSSLDLRRLRCAADIRSAPLSAASIFLDILNVHQLFLSLDLAQDVVEV